MEYLLIIANGLWLFFYSFFTSISVPVSNAFLLSVKWLDKGMLMELLQLFYLDVFLF